MQPDPVLAFEPRVTLRRVILAALAVAVVCGVFMELRPGWNSVEGVSGWHRFFQVGKWGLAACVLLMEAASLYYSARRDQLQRAAQAAAETRRAQQSAEAERRVHEAEQAAARAEAKAAATERHLTPEQIEVLRRVLATYPTGRLGVSAHSGNGEAIAFGDELADAIRAAGWSVKVGNALMFDSPPGLVLGICAPKGTPRMETTDLGKLRPRELVPRAAFGLADALAQAGLQVTSFDIYESDYPGAIGLTVGHKPAATAARKGF